MTDSTLTITDAHRELAAYLRSRQSEFGQMSDLAYEVIRDDRPWRQALIELAGTDNFSAWGPSNSQHWTDAYRRVLDLVPLDSTEEAEAPEDTSREGQARAIATMRRRVAEAEERAATAERQREYAQSSYAAVANQYSHLQQRVEQLNDDLNEQAVEREWCGEFEDFVERFSDILSVKTTTYTVTLEIEVKRGTGSDAYSVADEIYEFDRSALVNAIQSVDEI